MVVVRVDRGQRFRGYILYAGWNYIPLTSQPLTSQAGSGTRSVEQYFQQLITNRSLATIWWFDSRNQEWKFFDPDPRLSPFNSLTALDVGSNPPAVVAVRVSRGQQFLG